MRHVERKPGETREYDGEGERVIADLPPGLYFCVGKRGVVVGIDRDRRARVFPFLPGGGRGEGRPYRGHALALARAAFERHFCHYMGWPLPNPAEATDGYEQARAVTPWSYRALEG